MKYGLIGERLGHSFSREIHGMIGGYEYELCEIPKSELERFALEGEFRGINVTIPYKEAVIPYLDEIDAAAEAIGAVNTVVRRGGRLCGFNTDYYGITALIERIGLTLRDRKVAILGSGGTSHTARAVAKDLGAGEILTVSRTAAEGKVTYGELYERHTDIDVVINTTPVGMFPRSYETSLDISRFGRLSGVVDTVYNPLRTPLVQAARKRGIPAEAGLYMLVAQAVRASEIFLDKKYPDGTLGEVFEKIRRKKENVVLIGMPASGKSTVARIIAQKLSREVLDTDGVIERDTGKAIPDIIKGSGETAFRAIECEAVKKCAMATSSVIATGGGAVLREENIDALRSTGRLFFIDRPLNLLVPTRSRPLSSDREAMKKRYEERYDIYLGACDVRIDADATPTEVAERILENF